MIIIVDDAMCPLKYISEGEVIDAMMKFGTHETIGEVFMRNFITYC